MLGSRSIIKWKYWSTSKLHLQYSTISTASFFTPTRTSVWRLPCYSYSSLQKKNTEEHYRLAHFLSAKPVHRTSSSPHVTAAFATPSMINIFTSNVCRWDEGVADLNKAKEDISTFLSCLALCSQVTTDLYSLNYNWLAQSKNCFGFE